MLRGTVWTPTDSKGRELLASYSARVMCFSPSSVACIPLQAVQSSSSGAMLLSAAVTLTHCRASA
eukprot:2580562-Amphidinium_carterae.1